MACFAKIEEIVFCDVHQHYQAIVRHFVNEGFSEELNAHLLSLSADISCISFYSLYVPSPFDVYPYGSSLYVVPNSFT